MKYFFFFFIFLQGTKILHGEPKIPSNDCNLIGRDKEVEQIVSHLKTGSTRIISVYGPPGSGKSEVSKAVGQILQFQGKAVYHINLTNIDKEDKLISAILRFFCDQQLGPLKAVDFLWLIVLCETKRNETKRYFAKRYFAKRLQHNGSSHLIWLIVLCETKRNGTLRNGYNTMVHHTLSGL